MKLFRQILPTLLVACLLAQPAVIATQSQPRKDAPNILLILVDDFGSRDLSVYGSTTYETPNMDRVAATGTRFTQAYVAYPRCVPSRFAFFTGKHPAHYQGTKDSVHVEPGRDVTFGQAFQQAGYETFYCGKWHLGDGASNPDKVGFTKTIAAGAAGATRSHFAPYNQARRGGGGGGEEAKAPITGLDDAPAGEYLTDRLTEETAKFIEQNRNRPFLAVLAHYAVHTPIEAKENIKQRYAKKIAAQKWPEKTYEPESAGENLLVQNNATYAAMVESADQSVGRLMKLLDQLNLTEKTIVVIASDHGGLSARGNKREVATSNRPLRAGKGHLYEGGLRIPLIIRWPGKTKAGSVNDTPVLSMDLFPTFLEMAGLPAQPENQLDGVSIAGLLKGGKAPAARNLYWHNPAPRPVQTADLLSSAIRIGNLKLIEFPEEQRIELYDLDKDIGEARNLATERPADRDRLLQALHAWKQKVGARDKSRERRK